MSRRKPGRAYPTRLSTGPPSKDARQVPTERPCKPATCDKHQPIIRGRS